MRGKISIIVPIYNVDKYLEECLESLINQTYRNIEIILINDGSTDSSLEICKRYKKVDKRIVLIDKKNEGVSKARNIGLKKASGDYLMFVDSDDYLELNAIELLSQNVSKETLVMFGYNRVYRNCIVKKGEYLVINSQTEMERSIFLNDNIGGFIANKIFNRQLIIDNDILFNENLSYCEDLMFVCDYIKCCKNFKYINVPFYNYRMRKSSVSYSFLTGKNVSILNTYELLLKKFEDEVIVNNIKYRYIESYYIFKKYLNKDLVNSKILNEEKEIIKNNCKSFFSKIKFLVIKYFYGLGLLYKRVENIKFKLFK